MTTPAVGHNNPPSPLATARASITALGHFLQSNPTIDHTNATEAARLIESSRRLAQDIDKERDDKVRPLNEQVAEINAEYKAVHNKDSGRPGTLDKLLSQLKDRVADFAHREETRRAAEAAEARRIADEAARVAREAEETERAAQVDAAFGNTAPGSPDIATATVEADQAFAAFQKTERQAARAEAAVPVRLGTGLGRAVSLRTKETLIVDNWMIAITTLGVTETIREAILSSARAYRKLNDKLPAGVRAETERGM